MKKPNLFIVGQPKSGTTALASFLDLHPDIFISKPKEPHFFCSDFHKESNDFHKEKSKKHFEFQNLKDYLTLFHTSKGALALGEASTNYLYSKNSAKEIKLFNPNAKIIAIIREPVSLLHSLHMQYYNDTSENEKDFERALDLEKQRKNGKYISKRVRSPSYLFYSERIKYAEQIKRYLKLFPKRQLKIIIFNDFKKDNPRIYKKVLEFLGTNPDFQPNFAGIHESKSPKSNFINKIFRTPWIKNIPKKILPVQVYDKIQLKVQALLMKKEEREPINEKLKIELMKKFKPEVIKLNDLLHKEGFLEQSRNLVKEWGYNKV